MSQYKQKFNPISGQFNLVSSAVVMTFKEGVANQAALPPTGNSIGDARITNDDGHLYVWDGTQWVDQGDIIDVDLSSKEDVSNKSDDETLGGGTPSSTLYPTQAAVKDYVDSLPSGGASIVQDDTASLDPDETKIITHASEPLFKRLVQILIPYVTSSLYLYNIDNEANYDYESDEIEFDGQSAHLAPGYGALGMVGYYIFKDSEVKDVFNSHDGTNYNCTFGTGIVDNDLILNGTSAYLDLPNHSDYYIVDPQSHAIGFEFWIKTTATSGDIIGLWNETDNRRSWRIYLDSGNLHFDLSSDGINADFTSMPITSGLINDGNWHHVGIYLDNYMGWGGRYYAVYKDGNQHGLPGFTGFGSYPLYQNIVDPIRVGALGGGTASNFFAGEIAELAIYKNFDLTSAYGMYSSYFQFHYNQNIMGSHLSAYSLNRVSITTATSIDTSDWLFISSLYPWVENYGDCIVSMLFSIDGRTTWKRWVDLGGGTWGWETCLSTDEGTNVNSIPGSQADWNLLFVAGTLDIIVQLKTNDVTYNPAIMSISINYGKAGYMEVNSKVKFHLIDATRTEIRNATNDGQAPETVTDIKTNIIF